MAKAEKIKTILLERYKKEYEQFLKDRKLAEEAREKVSPLSSVRTLFSSMSLKH
jgi:hypothetical protein